MPMHLVRHSTIVVTALAVIRLPAAAQDRATAPRAPAVIASADTLPSAVTTRFLRAYNSLNVDSIIALHDSGATTGMLSFGQVRDPQRGSALRQMYETMAREGGGPKSAHDGYRLIERMVFGAFVLETYEVVVGGKVRLLPNGQPIRAASLYEVRGGKVVGEWALDP